MRKYLDWVCGIVGGFFLTGTLFFSLSFVMIYSGEGEWTRRHQWQGYACVFWWLSLIVWTIIFALFSRELKQKHPNDQTRSVPLLNALGFVIPLCLVWLNERFTFL